MKILNVSITIDKMRIAILNMKYYFSQEKNNKMKFLLGSIKGFWIMKKKYHVRLNLQFYYIRC